MASVDDKTLILLEGARERIGTPTGVRVFHTDDVDEVALLPTDGTGQHDYQVSEQGRLSIRWARIPDDVERTRVECECSESNTGCRVI